MYLNTGIVSSQQNQVRLVFTYTTLNYLYYFKNKTYNGLKRSRWCRLKNRYWKTAKEERGGGFLTYLPFQSFERRYIVFPSNAFGWKKTKTNTVRFPWWDIWCMEGTLVSGPMLWKWLVLLTLKGVFRCFYVHNKPSHRLISNPFKCSWNNKTNKRASEPHYVLLLT